MTREQVSATAARPPHQLRVRDLALAEPEVEDVIQSVFSGELQGNGPALTV